MCTARVVVQLFLKQKMYKSRLSLVWLAACFLYYFAFFTGIIHQMLPILKGHVYKTIHRRSWNLNFHMKHYAILFYNRQLIYHSWSLKVALAPRPNQPPQHKISIFEFRQTRIKPQCSVFWNLKNIESTVYVINLESSGILKWLVEFHIIY